MLPQLPYTPAMAAAWKMFNLIDRTASSYGQPLPSGSEHFPPPSGRLHLLLAVALLPPEEVLELLGEVVQDMAEWRARVDGQNTPGKHPQKCPQTGQRARRSTATPSTPHPDRDAATRAILADLFP